MKGLELEGLLGKCAAAVPAGTPRFWNAPLSAFVGEGPNALVLMMKSPKTMIGGRILSMVA